MPAVAGRRRCEVAGRPERRRGRNRRRRSMQNQIGRGGVAMWWPSVGCTLLLCGVTWRGRSRAAIGAPHPRASVPACTKARQQRCAASAEQLDWPFTQPQHRSTTTRHEPIAVPRASDIARCRAVRPVNIVPAWHVEQREEDGLADGLPAAQLDTSARTRWSIVTRIRSDDREGAAQRD